MYQRYYKQKKFGRFFGFFIVIGSGTYHFVKTNINVVRNQFTLKNLIKFENYLPDKTKILTDSVKQYLKFTNQVDNVINKTNLEMESKFHIYSKNLEQLNTVRNIDILTKNPTIKRDNIQPEPTLINMRESKLMKKEDWIEYEKTKENIYYYQKIRKKVNNIISPKH